jgi:hypothetical protein
MANELEKLQLKALARDVANAIVLNNGIMTDENGDELTVNMRDMLRKEDLVPLMPEQITHVMLEEIEPASVIYSNFFSEVMATETQQSLMIHNIGPVSVQPLGEYGEYPETNLSMDTSGYEINLRMQKYGLELRVHEDVLNMNLVPVVSMWMARARNAFIRNREKLAIQELKKHGIVVFDNDNPSNYTHEVKSYSGRNIAGVANGTMSLNDLMEVYVSALLEGFTIDTIAMNPLAWQTFMVDPEMREIVLNNNTVVTYKAPNGSAALGRYKELEGLMKLGLPWSKGAGNPTLGPEAAKLGQNPYAMTKALLGMTLNIPPRYFPTPLTIVVSPFVPVRQVGNTMVTDIFFAQSGEAGIVLRDGEPVVREIALPEKEAMVIRMREGLGFGVLNLGKAVRICRNVVVDRNYVFENYNSVSLSEITRSDSQGPF